jgi:CRISPR-associated protein Csx17
MAQKTKIPPKNYPAPIGHGEGYATGFWAHSPGEYFAALGLLNCTGTKGYWHSNGNFYTDRPIDELLQTIQDSYTVRPWFSPWNNESLWGLVRNGKEPAAIPVNWRWEEFQTVWDKLCAVLDPIDAQLRVDKPNKKIDPKTAKPVYLPALQQFEGKAAQWWRSALVWAKVPRKKSVIFEIANNALLGSGGNVGKTEYSAKYFEAMRTAFTEDGAMTPEAIAELRAIISGESVPNTTQEAALWGHLAPLADSALDYKKGGTYNNYAPPGTSAQAASPWAVALAIEGISLIWGDIRTVGDTGEAGDTANIELRFPLHLKGVCGDLVGHDYAVDKKGVTELWLPLWSEPLKSRTITRELNEAWQGRLRSNVIDTLDMRQYMAQSAAGADVHRLVRYAFIDNRKSKDTAGTVYQGLVKLGGTDLFSELHQWRRQIHPNDKQPNAQYQNYYALSEAFTRCAQGMIRPSDLIIRLGEVELYNSPQTKKRLGPCPNVAASTVIAAYRQEATAEFRLALSLASAGLRRNISKARYNPNTRHWFWSEDSPKVATVQLDGMLLSLLRLWFAADGIRPRPFIGAQSQDIAAFIAGVTDNRRLLQLAIGLSLCEINQSVREATRSTADTYWPIPNVYKVGRRLLWDNAEAHFSLAGINALGQGDLRGLISAARQQQIKASLPPQITPATGRRLLLSLAFPVQPLHNNSL